MTRNILIGIVIVAVLVAGGWWYFNQLRVPATSVTTESQTYQNTDGGNTATSQTNPKPTDTSGVSNWKTYSSTEFGFSVKYPPTLNPFVSARSGDSQAIISFVTDAVMVIIDMGSTLDKAYQVVIETYANYVVETGVATIGGIEGKYIHVKNHPDGPTYVYVVKSGDVVYRIFVIEKFIGNGNREKFVSSFSFTQ